VFDHYQHRDQPRRVRPVLLLASGLVLFATLTVFMWGARALLEAVGYRFDRLPVEVTYDPYEDGRPPPDAPERLPPEDPR